MNQNLIAAQKSKRYRDRLRENEPEKYAAMIAKQNQKRNQAIAARRAAREVTPPPPPRAQKLRPKGEFAITPRPAFSELPTLPQSFRPNTIPLLEKRVSVAVNACRVERFGIRHNWESRAEFWGGG